MIWRIFAVCMGLVVIGCGLICGNLTSDAFASMLYHGVDVTNAGMFLVGCGMTIGCIIGGAWFCFIDAP
jgi:hypothetical protein